VTGTGSGAGGGQGAGSRRTLTVLVPTYNEEANIAACLESVRFADEILVVDSFSTDRTLEEARPLATRVLQHEYVNSAAQKNWSLPQSAHRWILVVDADEQVSPELASEIQGVLAAGPAHDGYVVRRLNHFHGKPIRHGGWGRDRVLRFFNRDRGRYQEKDVHAEVEVQGSVAELKHPLLHDTFTGFTDRPSYADARRIAERLIAAYVDEEVDRVELVYNRFVSPLTQFVRRQRLLPHLRLHMRKVADHLALGILPVIHRVYGEETDLGRFGINSVGAQDLARGFGGFRGLIVGGLGGVCLGADVELDHRGVGSGFELAIGADEDGVGQRGERGSLGNGERGQHENGTKNESGGFHRIPPEWSVIHRYQQNAAERGNCGRMLF